MVAKMIRWRPWPPIMSKKFEVRLVVRRIEGVEEVREGEKALMAEVRWKGPKLGLGSLRRTVKRNCTREEGPKEGVGSIVEWNEEFESVCGLTFYKENSFHPWEVEIRVFNGLKQGQKNKAPIIGVASLNLAQFAYAAEEEIEINLPLLLPGVYAESHPSLNLALSLLELRTQESSETVQRSSSPSPLSPSSGDALSSEKDELSAFKAGLQKVKFFKGFVSTRKTKKSCREDEGSEGRCSARSEDVDYPCPLDTDSLDEEPNEGEVEEGKDDSSFRKSFSYGTLATANYVGDSIYSDMKINGDHEDWVYYSNRRSDVGCSHAEEVTLSGQGQNIFQITKRSILPWRKRKMSFRSPKAKGEPLLKKGNVEEGGDDIDYDRRQLSSSDDSLSGGRHAVSVANGSSPAGFGNDNFAVGSWEPKEVVSRDGQMKLSAEVFFASIDQRNVLAGGKDACTTLVAVIAEWLQSNRDTMPNKSQFDSLIQEGSLEWRKLCNNETYKKRFPDKHFDLETVLQEKIRPFSVAHGKSRVGFFHPEGTGDHSGFDVLHGAKSFDSIWEEEISGAAEPRLYIVSWNDHFFVLKVECDTYYIIDTLGERLFEGCDQAYILKFDHSTAIRRVYSEAQKNSNSKEEEEIVCDGRESCKEYIKNFLAAIPIRDLEADIKKGSMPSTTLLHRLLQIEFHYTEPLSEEASRSTSVVLLSGEREAVPMSPREELCPNEEVRNEEVPMSPSEALCPNLNEELCPNEEAKDGEILLREELCPNEEAKDEEFLLRREEPVVASVTLTQAVEVV